MEQTTSSIVWIYARACDELFQGLHKDSIQRKINRARREGLRYEEGRSDSLLHEFYRLTMITRRRQALPPPPFVWFRNVVDCLGEQVKIRVAVLEIARLQPFSRSSTKAL